MVCASIKGTWSANLTAVVSARLRFEMGEGQIGEDEQ